MRGFLRDSVEKWSRWLFGNRQRALRNSGGGWNESWNLKWTPMFEPLGAFFKLVIFGAAPVSVVLSFLRAAIILERENDVG